AEGDRYLAREACATDGYALATRRPAAVGFDQVDADRGPDGERRGVGMEGSSAIPIGDCDAKMRPVGRHRQLADRQRVRLLPRYLGQTGNVMEVRRGRYPDLPLVGCGIFRHDTEDSRAPLIGDHIRRMDKNGGWRARMACNGDGVDRAVETELIEHPDFQDILARNKRKIGRASCRERGERQEV